MIGATESFPQPAARPRPREKITETIPLRVTVTQAAFISRLANEIGCSPTAIARHAVMMLASPAQRAGMDECLSASILSAVRRLAVSESGARLNEAIQLLAESIAIALSVPEIRAAIEKAGKGGAS